MASYKSRFNPPARQEGPAPYTQRTTFTRLPTRSVTPTSASQIPTPSTTKLQKRVIGRESERAHTVQSSDMNRIVPKAPQHSEYRKAPQQQAQPSGGGLTMMSRSIPQSSSLRMPRFEVGTKTRTPSLISGSSTSTVDSPRSNKLKKKPSSVGKQAVRARSGSAASQSEPRVKYHPNGYQDPFSEAILGINPPPSSTIVARHDLEFGMADVQYGYENSSQLAMDELPPPTTLYTASASPSTRYSGSPGQFSHSSTPTSMSSHSPSLTLSSKMTPRLRQPSPLESRPPVTRRNAEEPTSTREKKGLSAVRESSTSSSSASTVRAGVNAKKKEGIIAPKLSIPLPTPPLQSSTVQSPQSQTSTMAISPIDRSRPQAPPELAHLADDLSPRRNAAAKPTRPSRDGTPEILSLRDPSPVIQSNLSSLYSFHHKRQGSSDSRTDNSPFPNGSRTRLVIPSKVSSRNPSPSPSNASGYPPLAIRPPTRDPTPDIQSDGESKHDKSIPSSATSPSKASSRFGFFTRRAKTEPIPKPEKKSRKGPMAGTGYEGYGRYGIRGRSGSTTSGTGSVGRSASADSTTGSVNGTYSTRKSSIASKNGSELDGFFLDRLTPVVLRGSGTGELCASPVDYRSGSSLDSVGDRPSIEMRFDAIPRNQSSPMVSDLHLDTPTLLPSLMSENKRPSSPVKKIGLGLRRPSESEDERKNGFRLPKLSSRRSARRSQLLEADINSNLTPDTKTEQSSTTENISVNVIPKKSQPQPKLTRKWNFFQRAQASPRTDNSADVTTVIARPPPSRSVAHYAMMDGMDMMDLKDLGEIMQDANIIPEDNTTSEYEHNLLRSQNRPNPEYVQSILLPSPPGIPSQFSQSPKAEPPKVALQTGRNNSSQPLEKKNAQAVSSKPEKPSLDATPHSSIEGSVPASAPARPSRLPQVGRIPQVVSKRDHNRKLPDRSFSRPFVPGQPRPTPQFQRTSSESAVSILATAGPISSEIIPALQALNGPQGNMTEGRMSASEFFSFSPRKNSEVSFSGSSGFLSINALTAVIPAPGAPPMEDEVWKEYDDLIDEVLSPVISSGAVLSSRLSRPSSELSCSGSDSDLRPEPLSLKSNKRVSTSALEVPVSNDQTASVHLRRSRLLSILRAYSPTTGSPVSDHFRSSIERGVSIIDPVTSRLSLHSGSRASSGSGRPGSTRASLPASISVSSRHSNVTAPLETSSSSNRYRDTKLMEMADPQSDGIVSMANLRLGALMTSKWLSFGRVLFSPAHFDMKDSSEDRILIVDGLGKDWSYYCALTYPEATVYNLGPSPEEGGSASGSNNTPWSNVPNHRHIHHPNPSGPFPFPRGFFAAVVFRFPIASSEAVCRAIIFECKRVLRPGGYLEISMLDLDLLNMGNRARRAIRNLKMQMQVADPSINLGPVSDNIQKMLGRRGFENLNRCMVGVPIAGRVYNEGPINTTGSPEKETKDQQEGRKLLFTELLSSSTSNDADITDMVSRVGRWWYSRCYESLVLPEGDQTCSLSSIWKDEALLRECEKWGTSFKLLICYAQKPMVAPRRTVSL